MIVIPSTRQYASNNIRKYRKAAGLTLEELGQKLQPPVTFSTVQKLEKSQMGLTLDYIVQISQVLNIELAALVDDRVDDACPEELHTALSVRQAQLLSDTNKLEVPLRPDLSVYVTGLPLDLTIFEARKLANIISAFAVDDTSS